MADVQFFAYEDLSVSTTATGFTDATFDNADYAEVLVEGASVRFRLDDTAPTASVGDLLNVNDRLILEGTSEVSRAQFISKTGSTATLRCHFGVRK